MAGCLVRAGGCMRRLVSILAADHRLFGTLHEPAEAAKDAPCLLLLNAGPLPRSWNSDLPCEIGDRLADKGIRTFRFDLPGLGDTAGDVPELVELFRQGISNGRYDRTVKELAQRLRADFGVKQVVVSGLCAGAVASIRAIDAAPGEFAGMIMFEPDFRSAVDLSALAGPGKQVAPPPPPPGGAKPGVLRRAKRWMSKNLGRTAIEEATWLGPLQGPMVWLVARVFGRKLPPGTNTDLVESWRRIIRTRVPTLLLRAERGVDWRTRRILQALPALALSRSVHIVVVPKTNHMFNSGVGQATALEEVVGWMLRKFPAPAPVAADARPAFNGSPLTRAVAATVPGPVKDERR